MKKNIETLCKEKEEELLEKYFGNLAKEAAQIRPQTIGDYTKDLPARIGAEFRDCLKELWKGYSDRPLVLEERQLLQLITDSDRRAVEEAYKDATCITLWERITKSNHEDVANYKGLLYEYTRNLLMIMRIDFLEEITGRHITGKTFEQ